MTEQPPSWGDLHKPAAEPPRNTRFDELCMQVFTSPAGKELLKELRQKHFDSVANPLADERALRVRITQQQFVRDLEIACERGRAAITAKREAT